ncbi:hypothetical protein [Chamaesiphon sp. VAR_69_metabat_338]|uniref:hypothetical protein n=1 Tax=Chamaesiphon sp. VAR_69_metabat_338 TaxID=2964704 RepID=UPI00286D7019|nr:hypothetical protein [Chamaesiphon sp. VAR_69_metabat_338]
MPRLIGKISKTPLYTTLLIVVVAAAVTGLEYMGEIDIVPGFGRDNPTMRVSDQTPPRT